MNCEYAITKTSRQRQGQNLLICLFFFISTDCMTLSLFDMIWFLKLILTEQILGLYIFVKCLPNFRPDYSANFIDHVILLNFGLDFNYTFGLQMLALFFCNKYLKEKQ